MTNNNASSTSAVEAIAGFSSGVISTLISHPLDVIKTRLQVDRSSSSYLGRSLAVARNIALHEGSIKAFYRGLAPNLLGSSVSWSLYFVCYDATKATFSSYHNLSPGQNLSLVDYFAASGLAGATTAVLTNPIWVVKTRMLSSGRNMPGAYSGILQGWRTILRDDGFRGLYRGLTPSLFGVSHGAVQFMVYEGLKNSWRTAKRPDRGHPHGYETTTDDSLAAKKKPSNTSTVLFSGLAKTIAMTVTYPYQVVRARLQTYDAGSTYNSTSDAIVKMWRHEGVRGFYKGLGPGLIRILPTTCITFLTYENCRFYLPPLLERG